MRVNYALVSNGGVATASSTLPLDAGGPGTNWPTSGLNNGDRKGTNWGYGGGWADGTNGTFPDWIEIGFNGTKSIDEIDLFTIQDNYASPSEPTESSTFSTYGATGYDVEYWNGSAWVTVSGGAITGNNLVWRKLQFTAVNTTKIRVMITSAIDNGYSRMTEVEAWGNAVSMNVAASAYGGVASASSILSSAFPAAAVNNGDRKGVNWGTGGGWADANSGNFPDWIEIDFNGAKIIDEIDLFTIQDNYTSPSEPTETMTFSTYGTSGYNVEYGNGFGWTPISEGQISGNNKVWRKINFAPLTTNRIRVNVTSAIDDGYSRLTEIEAWGIATNSGGTSADFAMARLDPHNRTGTGGEDLLSNNFNWNLPIVSLSGRGLDLGLTLSYNSLVWIRSGDYIDFDRDEGSIAPGFRLGFPTLEGPYRNTQAAANFYLLVTPTGARVELRQIANSVIYESADSSHLQLTDNLNATMTLRPTDGSQLSFVTAGGGWRCNQIKDRNGNYLTVTYRPWGEIDTVTDTLGRVLTFNYDDNNAIQSITQKWNGSQPHPWATFGWGTTSIGHNFTALNNLGPDSVSIPVLSQVGLPDGSRYNFEYNNSYGIVSTIRNYASDPANNNHERGRTSYVLAASLTDCPRLTERHDTAEYWTNVNDVPAEVVTRFTHDADGACRLTAPDDTVDKEYYGSGWQSGLTIETRSYASTTEANSNAWRKRITTQWTQDNTSVGYLTNPRVTQTTIDDAAGNHRRTAIDYGSPSLGYVQWGLPYIVTEYSASGSELRHTQTDYNLSSPYLSRRIVGLPSSQQLYDATESKWLAKSTYEYDWGGEYFVSPNPDAVQHDTLNYGSGYLTGRGNLSAVKRWDVNDIDNNAKAILQTRVAYNSLGAVYFTRDALGHQTTLDYGDSFSDSVNRNTYAYPTALTDADGNQSFMQYNFEFGAKTRTQSPAPAGQSQGTIQAFTYDEAARLKRATTANNGAYTQYEYGPNYLQIYRSVNAVSANSYDSDSYTGEVFDGLGRVIVVARNHPGSSGGYSAVATAYDQMGRVFKQSNPTETMSELVPSGDDAAGWYYTQRTYDWKGRPLRTINQDGTYSEASYAGCGCAGGAVVTLTDEVGRRQKIYSDSLGRQWKSEVLNWDGTVYSTTETTLNALDQATLVRQFQGDDQSGVYQDTMTGFDGFGRLQSKHAPEQSAGTATVYAYNSDDTIQSVTDARGASASYVYNNNRHLLNEIDYSASAGVTPTSNVIFSYDAAGNRTSMTDGLGSQNYVYDQLSRLTSETRMFTGLGAFTLSYGYNYAGEVTSISDQAFNTSVTYSHDSIGRLSNVSSTGFPNVSTIASDMRYRAWGAIKTMSHGNGHGISAGYDSRLLPTTYQVSNVMSKTYQYNADARLDYSHDLIDARYDRKNIYDQAGRIQTALSGQEARGGSATTERPYNQTFGYDAFNNLSARISYQWDAGAMQDEGNYSNNRRVGWHYDADGNFLDDGSFNALQNKYDAHGQLTKIINPALPNDPRRTDDYDAVGVRIRTGYRDNFESPLVYTYYLRSTVLGGQIVDEINGNSQKTMGYVYNSSGGIMAVQKLPTINDNSTYFAWDESDPSGASVRMSNASGVVQPELSGELDPVGANNYTESPETQPPDHIVDETSPTFPSYGNPAHPGMGCSFNGIPLPCGDVFKRIADHAGPVTTYSNELRPLGTMVHAGLLRSTWSSQFGDVLVSNTTEHELTYWQQTGFARVSQFAGFFNVPTQDLQTPDPTPQQTKARNLLGECGIHAMLDTLSYSEHAGYDTVVMGTVIRAPGHPDLLGKTNVTVPDFSAHPNILVQAGRWQSTAAGRYQFLNRTWNGLGLSNFQPFNQDIGAVMLMQRRGMITPLLSGDIEQAIENGNGEWASLPGSPYGQGTRSMNSLKKVYDRSFLDCVRAMHEIHQGVPNDNGV